MFRKATYFAVVLFWVFVFRIFCVNIAPLITSSQTPQSRLALCSFNYMLKDSRPEYVQHGAKADPLQVEVSEESTESDTSENLEKFSKYPSFLIAFFQGFNPLANDAGLFGHTYNFLTKQSSRTYLAISVLRI